MQGGGARGQRGVQGRGWGQRGAQRGGAPFGVRHHREVAAVRGAEGGDAVGRAVGIEGVRFRGAALRVRVAQRREAALEHRELNGLIREVAAALAVRDPDADVAALHAGQHHRRRRLDLYCAPAALEAACMHACQRAPDGWRRRCDAAPLPGSQPLRFTAGVSRRRSGCCVAGWMTPPSHRGITI